MSRPPNTRSRFGNSSSSCVTSKLVLNAHSASPTPVPRSLLRQGMKQRSHWHWTSHSCKPMNWRHLNYVNIKLRERHSKLTGSGILPSFRSSTWTVVGKSDTFNHSPSFVPWPPPTCVNDQSSNERETTDLVPAVTIVTLTVPVKPGGEATRTALSMKSGRLTKQLAKLKAFALFVAFVSHSKRHMRGHRVDFSDNRPFESPRLISYAVVTRLTHTSHTP